MVRSTKVEKTTSVAPAATAPVSLSAPVTPAPVETKATKTAKAAKATKATKADAPKATEPVAVAPIVAAAPEPVASAPVVATEEPESVSSESRLADLESKSQQIGAIWTSMKSVIKELRKSIIRDKKAAEKSSKTKAAKKVNKDRKPSGFTKPTLISDELAKFLGKETGTEMSRTSAAKEVIAYIKSNKLTDEKNGRIIHPDAALSALLKVTSADNLHYFNLQTFMKPHFIKTVAVATA
jgi:chromatin remodeling complex protein RSC6